MNYLTSKTKMLTMIVTLLALLIQIQSCEKDGLLSLDNNKEFLPKLSEYKIFQGNPSDLLPTSDFNYYEISTTLFTDYAEKQRLIKIPKGSSLRASDDYLPDFPEGTMIVKTFYYFNDKRDPSKGKKIIETRLLIKSGATWNYGTYLWNESQTEANLITTGLNKTINWINESGAARVISYHIPNNRECVSCHGSGGAIQPIGPKIRNLNIKVVRGEATLNQLTYFKNIGILNALDPSSFSTLPNWHDTTLSIENRARAYLEVNCAHCHNHDGLASRTNLYFSYEIPSNETKIVNRKDQIRKKMSTGKMPKLGTTIIDEEGLALIKSYIESL